MFGQARRLPLDTKRLIVGETINPPGNWSSFPPHKHDTDNPPEGVYEEVYFFLVRPRGGFGLSRVYERREAVDARQDDGRSRRW